MSRLLSPILISSALVIALGVTSAACVSAPAFAPTGHQARTERLTPFSPQRLRPHPAVLAGDLSRVEAEGIHAPDHSEEHLAESPAQATAYLWWRAYSATYSRVDGATCNFAPSCSRFGLEAIAHSPLGVVWTFGRLQRDQRPDAFYTRDADGRLIDPVEAYTVWGDDPTLDRSPYVESPHHGWYLFVQAQRSGLADDLLERHRGGDAAVEPDAGKR
ncbi:membrane protein insertion efficiency factor YidD [Lujinxingia vulgaris]|uniref:Membrane protein insertion efficiency factor YidD n=1 Tax=Lujinxingia vulgaris TaxID=2600176 RepID=A0A5C6WVB0_9DELT|nr:membrane protein insertion efficiency factor YidD [Lujinxingia vulgaris]TXD32486.1 membrane protein insertion efficiency factor YidD [Lujinxingia vulgaris]